MPHIESTGSTSTGPDRTLTTVKVVLLVLAGIAPLTPIVSNIPLATMLGGPSIAGMYVLSGVIFLCFSVGYAEMASRLNHVEGLWTFIRAGLGGSPAGGGAWLALLGYFAILVGALGAGGYFFHTIVDDKLGIDLPWFVYIAALMVIIGVLASREIDFSVRVIGILVTCEVAVILVLALAIVVDQGFDAFPLDAFSWSTLSNGNPGIVLMYATLSFLAFEAASLYASEARDPQRTIPRSIVASVAIVTVCYVLCTWIVLGALGISNAQTESTEQGGTLLFNLADRFGGAALEDALSLFMLTSLLAVTLGLTNIAARNVRVLTSENLLPAWIGALDKRTGAPRRAAVAISALSLGLVAVLGLIGADPYAEIGGAFFGLGSVAIVGTQLLTSIAVLVYLHRAGLRHPVRHRILPAIGSIGLLVVMVLILREFSSITGKTEWYYSGLPYVALAVLVGGAARGWWASRKARSVNGEVSEPV
jgi:amino acid transporter